ncbi:hypothetical protein Tco_0947154 [Tanacetum coccineum]
MSTLTQDVLAAASENRPPMFEKASYDTWQSRLLMYVKGNEMSKSRRPPGKRLQAMADLNADEHKEIECDIMAANIVLQGLPNDIN